MTKVEIISGFLGAGKTTLIKKLIQGAFPGEKVVLIENEYGEVGVDGGFMRDSGLTMTEINSGCICCTLAGDFIDAIDTIVEQYAPDRILIEPSGVGKLSDIRAAVSKVAEEHDMQLAGCATVADVNRCRLYLKNFGEFYEDQIKNAGTVILSRTQKAAQEKIDGAIELLRAYNADAAIVTTPWDEMTPERMLQAIEKPGPLLLDASGYVLDEDDDEEEEHHHHHHHDHDEHDEHDHDEHDEHDHDGHDHDGHDHDGHDHDDHDHDGHDHGHHDHHGHHHHHHHHHHDGHDADEVFSDIGIETAHVFDREKVEALLDAFSQGDSLGNVLRAKGIVKTTDGSWIEFDYVPGEKEIRDTGADYTGRVCVIGSELDEAGIRAALGL